MTVIHGDVYSKPRKAERRDLVGIKRKKGEWRRGGPDVFTEHRLNTWKIIRGYLSDATRAGHPSSCLSLEWDRSPLSLCDIAKACVVIMWTDSAHWHGWLMFSACSNSQHTQLQTPPLANKKEKKKSTAPQKGACAHWAGASPPITADNPHSVCELVHVSVSQCRANLRAVTSRNHTHALRDAGKKKTQKTSAVSTQD